MFPTSQTESLSAGAGRSAVACQSSRTKSPPSTHQSPPASRRQHGAFLGAVRDYNLEIADYALSAAQPGGSADRITAMLLEATSPSNARPALATAPSGSPAAPVYVQPHSSPFAAPAQFVAPDAGPLLAGHQVAQCPELLLRRRGRILMAPPLGLSEMSRRRQRPSKFDLARRLALPRMESPRFRGAPRKGGKVQR